MNVIGVRCRASCKEALFHYNPVRTTALPYLDRARFHSARRACSLRRVARRMAERNKQDEATKARDLDVTRRFESIDARPFAIVLSARTETVGTETVRKVERH